MIADPSARTGNSATLRRSKKVTTTRTDLTEMRKMHADLVAEYTVSGGPVYVRRAARHQR